MLPALTAQRIVHSVFFLLYKYVEHAVCQQINDDL
jgi:hypothetical protein